MTLCATCNHWPEGTACALQGCPGRKISGNAESTRAAARAADTPNTAALGPIACPHPFPFRWHRSIAEIDAAIEALGAIKARCHAIRTKREAA